MRLVEELEADALRRTLDLDALTDRGHAGHVDLQHCRGDSPSDMAVLVEGVRIEAFEVGEAPVLFRRIGKRERAIALEGVRPGHAARTCGGEGSSSRRD